jgi:hypothetical protein
MVRFLKFLVSLLPYIFVFIASLFPPYYLDLGWHLKYGEYLFKHGQILRENIYSTMMPGYQWANGSWGMDALSYFIFSSHGFLGLTIAGAVVVTLTFFFFAKASRLTLLEKAFFFPLLVYLLHPVNSFSFRGQQVSLLFLGILYFILSKYKSSSKIFFFIPILFFIWANLDRSSLLGLVIFGLWTGFVLIKSFVGTKNKKIFFKEGKFLISIFLLTFLATLINPFGFGIHLAAFDHFGNPAIKNITEYIPFLLFSNSWWNHMFVMVFMFGLIIYLFRNNKLIEYLPIWGIPLILLVLAFDIRRYAWPAYYLMFPVLHLLWEPAQRYIKKHSFYIAYVIILISIAFAVLQKIPFNQFTMMSWEKFCLMQNFPCTSRSAIYLKDHKLTQNLFSLYDWGGYLIWNHPEIKPSIDGRMTAWKGENGYSALAEYYSYINGERSIDKSSYDVVYINPNRSMPLYRELMNLVREKKWRLIYEDGFIVIIVRSG